MPGDHIRLLALDGGGVRGLSSLIILRRLMATIDPASPPKPCDYFDLIGGTSTGGLIAVMLGRLRMTVDECIAAYTSLSDRVFEKKSYRVNIRGKLQGRFDAAELENAIKKIVLDCNLDENALLKDLDAPCKVFVCATSKETGDTTCLSTYRSPRSDNSDLLEATTIWQACRATSAATTFFDPIAIGPFSEEFVDGALGTNNPVYAVWNQAKDIWGAELLHKLVCLVSVGTGVPNLSPVRDDVLGIWATLKDIATETERTARLFHQDKSSLDDEGRYYRFNVEHGLEDIGLEESKKKNEIVAVTRRYIESQAVSKQIKTCANSLARRDYVGPYQTRNFAQAFEASKAAFQKDLGDDKVFKELLKTTTIEKVWAATQEIQAKQDSQGRLRNMRRIETFLDRVRAYAATVDRFVQDEPDIMALIWGPIRVLLEWTSSDALLADAVLSAMEKIGNVLPPQFGELAAAFHDKDCVGKKLVLFYEDILEFHLIALKFFKPSRHHPNFNSVWPRQRDRVDVVVTNIERHAALMQDEATHVQIFEAQKHRAQALAHFDRESEAREQQQLQALRTLVSPRLYHDTLDYLLNRACGGSGQPLLHDADFARWLDASNRAVRLLWLHGIPGAGKTFLSAMAISEARGRGHRTPFTFISHRDQGGGTTARTILLSLLFQVASDEQEARAVLVDAEEQVLRGSTTDVSKLLKSVLLQVDGGRPTYVFVDGLDEMETSERFFLLEKLSELVGGCPDLHMLVSSRLEDDIAEFLEKKAVGLRVDKKNSASITAYVEQRLTVWTEKGGFDQKAQRNIRQLCAPVAANAKGMFLYARIVLDNACQFEEISEIEKELEVLPRDLDDAYHRVFSRIRDLGPPARQRKALKILGWIGCAPTPLTRLEMEQALLVDSDASPGSERAAPRVELPVKFNRICGPIIEVVDEYPRFVHFTVKEYIFSNDIPGSIDESQARYGLAKVTLSYLTSGIFDTELSDNQIKDNILSGRYRLHWLAVSQWIVVITRCLSRTRDFAAYPDLMDRITRLALELRNYNFTPGGEPWNANLKRASVFAPSIVSTSPDATEAVDATIEFLKDNRQAEWSYDNISEWLNHNPLTTSGMAARIYHQFNQLVCTNNKAKDKEHMEKIRNHYGSRVFKCRFASCGMARQGLNTMAACKQHEQQHGRPYKCSVAGCPYAVFGFAAGSVLYAHQKKLHPDDARPSAVHDIPSEPTKGFFTERLYEATNMGDTSAIQPISWAYFEAKMKNRNIYIDIKPSMLLAAQMGSRPLMEAITMWHQRDMVLILQHDHSRLVPDVVRSGSPEMLRWLLDGITVHDGHWSKLSALILTTDSPDVYSLWEEIVLDPTPTRLDSYKHSLRKRTAGERPPDDDDFSDPDGDRHWDLYRGADTLIPLHLRRRVLFISAAFSAVSKSSAHEARLLRTWARLIEVLGKPIDPRFLGWSLTCLGRTSASSIKLATELLRLGAPIDFPRGITTIHQERNQSKDSDDRLLRKKHRGLTALHFACRGTSERSIRLARFLLEEGADPELGWNDAKPAQEEGARLMGKVLGESWDDVVTRTASKRSERKAQRQREASRSSDDVDGEDEDMQATGARKKHKSGRRTA